jgi:hypothetical protein
VKFVRFLCLALRWIAIIPAGCFGLLVAAFVRLAWGKSSRWERGIWWVTLDAESWPMTPRRRFGGWYAKWGGTTFGPLAVMLAPKYEHNVEVMAHEAHHTEQAEAHAGAGFAIAVACAALGHFALAALVWTFIGRIVGISASVCARARGQSQYMGNVMEEGAYAVGREAKP